MVSEPTTVDAVAFVHCTELVNPGGVRRTAADSSEWFWDSGRRDLPEFRRFVAVPCSCDAILARLRGTP